ncbi:MAG: cation:proton antiporter [Thermoguttaceae bacterium]|nr:cation:proton antiporter [Thermoguttaceae bacterium]
MGDAGLITTLTTGLAFAVVFGYLALRVKLSPIVGYLLAGILISPHTLGLAVNQGMADQFAEIGVVLLMFGVGLEFHFKELFAVRKVALPGALTQSMTTTTVVTLLLHFLIGMNWASALVLALSLSVASTVVLVRVLADTRDLHTPAGHIAVGWLVVEDLFTVIVLVILPAVFPRSATEPEFPVVTPPPVAQSSETASVSIVTLEELEQRAANDASDPNESVEFAQMPQDAPSAEAGTVGSISLAVGIALFKIALLIAFSLVIGSRVIPLLLERVAKTHSRELFTLTVLVCALGIAVASAAFFDVSMALGAFLAGMIVGRSEFSYRAAADAFPMRDAFAVLFFVSVGMLLDPNHLLEHPGTLAIILGAVMIGKPIISFTMILLLRYPVRTALTVGLSLSQIGEFSFILTNLGRDLGVLSPGTTNLLVAASMFSITLNPILYRLVGPLEKQLQKMPAVWTRLNGRVLRLNNMHAVGNASHEELHRSIIVGYGPVGKIVTRILQQNHIEPIIIEMNLNTVRQLHANGIRAVYGDASAVQTLRGAEIETAEAMILSSDGLRSVADVIRQARELNPVLRILARTSYVSQIKPLQLAGADAVFAGEGELSLAFAETLLRYLGATAHQIEQERARIHQELLGADSIEDAFTMHYKEDGVRDLRAPDADHAETPPAGVPHTATITGIDASESSDSNSERLPLP